ncbi:carboxymuconolactone decarboxylase family protein [Tsukamurella sp. 8F]|uniref:carboxymuconolactone decarboxylase family protein n=1 Tax=Tsukamurella sp. 8F TaxID=3031961 RepID=UPI0023B8B8EC|nr:carboxymuconolactone decarboxylase family protein [Tsukamurella sp. 8F]MDF0586089.1 carboxymuconolactone decarboxylase family protein [Tsukamurella sp. 8F]
MARTSGFTSSPDTYRALVELDTRLGESLGAVLYDLVKLRASQINGCAFCVDMHSTDLGKQGVPVRTINGVAAWRETPFFDETQRVALDFAERLTGGVDEIPADLWDEAGRLLGETRRTDLIVAVGAINTWNMLGITTHLQPAP